MPPKLQGQGPFHGAYTHPMFSEPPVMNPNINSTPNPDYRKKYEAAMGMVKNQYQAARNGIQEQQSALPYQYQQQRTQVYDNANQTSKALDEVNAQRGLYRSGQATSDLSKNYATRDAGINSVNNRQQQAVERLTNQLNQLNASEATDIARLQGQEGQDLRNYNLQLGSLTGNIGGQQTIAAQQLAAQLAQQQQDNAYRDQRFNYQQGLDEAGLTGMYNGQQTLQAQQIALQNALAQAGLTGEYNGQQTLPAQQMAAQIQQWQQAQQLAQLESLMNYNLGVGQTTDDLPRIGGFNYGDAMNQLLKQIYRI